MAEPPPDIYELFSHYNSLYFGDALGACIVSWDPRMTSMTADCSCIEPGLCEILLSEPLLKSRSAIDLKNVLLHEMIHAFLWITHNSSNHSDHGSKFWTIADLINSKDNCKDDVQRPSDGYKITINHGFHDEVDTCSADERMIALVKGETGREPLSSDCTRKNGRANDRVNMLCERNKKACPDKYEGIAIISACEIKGKAVEDVQEIDRKDMKDRRCSKRPITMPEFFSSHISSENNFAHSKQLIIDDERTPSLSIGAKILKQRRISRWQNCSLSIAEESKYRMNEGEITLVMQIYGVCADEESEEESEPLINKRSERRKRMKFDLSDGRCGETGLTHEIICLDSSSQKSDYRELDQ